MLNKCVSVFLVIVILLFISTGCSEVNRSGSMLGTSWGTIVHSIEKEGGYLVYLDDVSHPSELREFWVCPDDNIPIKGEMDGVTLLEMIEKNIPGAFVKINREYRSDVEYVKGHNVAYALTIEIVERPE